MRDGDARCPAKSIIACRMSAGFGSTLDVAVQDENGRIVQGPGDGQQLALAMRDVRPALAQELAETPGQIGDEARARGFDRPREVRR
jgi:hypothetical protein